MTCGHVVCFAALLFVCPPSLGSGGDEADSAATGLTRIRMQDLKRHCATLASDAMEGREAGTNGGKAAAAYLLSELQNQNGISKGSGDGWLQEFGNDFRNILALIPGSDADVRHETILIGAHYDHVGRGNQTNSYGPFGHIHNGADDNASGTAALLELIDAFASLPTAPRRTIMFAFWDAEEMGLLGSKHWVAHPTRPLKDIRLTINLDMLGRLRDGKLTVMGWRSAPGLRARVAAANTTNECEYLYSPIVIADSDHYPFYQAGIPALHFDSCKHEDYHRPSDDADKLNYEGIQQLSTLIFRLAFAAANDHSLPTFRQEAFKEKPPTWMAARVTESPSLRLGVSFEPSQFQKNIAVVAQVTPGSPAQRVGIRAGDRITKLAHWDGVHVDDLRTIIQISKSPITLQVLRADAEKPLDLQVELRGSPVRLGISWQTDAAIPEAVAITQVIPDSPADRAGLKPGDVIDRFAGKSIPDDEEFRRRILNEPGPFEIRFERAGRTLNLMVDLFEPDSGQP